MDRTLEPELLDALPHDHPDAARNRRDLRLTNIAMGNYAWFRRVLPRLVRPGESVLEVGAGTGELGAQLRRARIAVDGLDLWPRPVSWPASAQWHQSDLRDFQLWDRYRVVIANLVLHQFSESELRELGARLQQCRVVVASEPIRRRASQVVYRAVAPLLGANYVTLHDAHVSIAAGFRGGELPAALGLSEPRWSLTVNETWIGAYRMIARARTDGTN
jgi:2-polyprenyl-3-methyl-5-hydroxy-6-metoxy-1,4-benzoquinol methylase